MNYHKYLILGAGPGGLQMAYFLQQSRSEYIVLERSEQVGSFFKTFPRSRQLISFNKVHSIFDDPEIQLRWDWNSLLTDDYGFLFRDFSQELYPAADDLIRYLKGFTQKYQLNIKYKTNIIKIQRQASGLFEVHSQEGEIYQCQVLIMATGFSQPYLPDIPGIELVENYEDVSMKPESFLGQRVLIIGKGNSAMEVADAALETAALIHVASPSSVTLAWNSRHAGHVRANYVRLLDAYQLKTLNGSLDCQISNIVDRQDGTYVATVHYVHADNEVEELVYDRIIRCTGFRIDTSIFGSHCQPETILQGRLPSITSYWESTNISNLFFAGVLMQGRDFKKSSSAFIDGFRYNIRTLYRYLQTRYEGIYPTVKKVKSSPQMLQQVILERASRTSSLWTQFGYLCDVLVIKRDKWVEWYEELPYQSIQEGAFAGESHYYSLTLEWGKWDGDVMEIQRHPSASNAYTNVFLHPILRRYSYGKLISVHHILEELFGTYSSRKKPNILLRRNGLSSEQWHRQEHELPLEQYLEKELASSKSSASELSMAEAFVQ